MKKITAMIILAMIMALFTLPAHATRKEGINGVVERVDTNKLTIASKSYRFSKQFRVVVVTMEGIHRYEKAGRPADLRVGDKVFAVVLYDEISDIYLERY